MAANKKLELRLAPAEGTQLYTVFYYLLRNAHLVGDGRGKAAEAITAFWLPFALEQAGEDPAKVEAVARDCVMLLEQQIYLLRRRFNLTLSEMSMMATVQTGAPSAHPSTTTPAPEPEPQPVTGFQVGAINPDYLLDDE